METKVLDNGFIRLVDVMGDDAAIVQAARVSYGKGTKTVSEDRGLIRYLMRKRHTSPFEMVEFKFHVKLPIFVARQWHRHRMASINEYSARYSEMKDEFYFPEREEVRQQSKSNKQGSAGLLDDTKAYIWLKNLIHDCNAAYSEYMDAIGRGVARELARIGLPLNIYTEMYWKIDLHNLLHFLKLRMDPHAQKEIRVYADAMALMVQQYCPLAYEAFEDYVLHAHTFSRQEMEILRSVIGSLTWKGSSCAERAEYLVEHGNMSGREYEEFKEALRILT